MNNMENLSSFQIRVLYIIYSLNALIIVLLFWRIIVINNDKGPLLMVFYYPFLILVNLFIAGVLRVFKASSFKLFVKAVKVLLVFMIPIILIAFTLG